jgi:hypothetical protein
LDECPSNSSPDFRLSMSSTTMTQRRRVSQSRYLIVQAAQRFGWMGLTLQWFWAQVDAIAMVAREDGFWAQSWFGRLLATK